MFDVSQIIEAGGLLLIALVIFAESGMFVGFFFPGDTLLVGAGVLAAAGKLEIEILIPVIIFAAILGDNIGYHIGKRYGRRLFKKKDGIIFRQAYVQHAEKFYEKYGAKMMLFAHFVPIVRTFAPPVAGVAHMDYKKFFLYDAVGIIAWGTSITLIGYWFGSKIPHLDKYVEYAIIAVMAIAIGPTIYHLIKAIRAKKTNPPTPAKVEAEE